MRGRWGYIDRFPTSGRRERLPRWSSEAPAVEPLRASGLLPFCGVLGLSTFAAELFTFGDFARLADSLIQCLMDASW